MKTVMVCLLSLVVAAPALADAPLNGTYKSNDIPGGTMLTGHYSEWWPTSTKLSAGNTMNEKSWDGSTLGTQWWWYCPEVTNVGLLYDGVSGGNGQKIWRLDYAGGLCWLDGNGPWGNGDAAYTAVMDVFTAIVTETYASGVVVGQVRTVSARATFQGYNSECINLHVSNTEWFGDTNGGSLPADFPEFWDGSDCTMVGTSGWGEWGDVTNITFDVVDCQTVPVKETSWGSLKALYQE